MSLPPSTRIARDFMSLLRRFALDPRGLATLRIGLGVLLCIDVLVRLQDFDAHYGTQGLVPALEYLDHIKNPYWISLHALLEDPWARGLMYLTAICAIVFALGYKTRWVNVLLWVLTASLHSANYMVAQAGDTAMRLLLFWGMFLPLGAVWSLDARGATKAAVPRSVATAPALIVVAQLLVVYGITAQFKLSHGVWRHGEAVYYAIAHETFSTELGVWFSQWPGLLATATWVTPLVQLLAVVLIPLCWQRVRVRVSVILVMISMHVGFMAFLHLGLFSFVMVVWWLTLLPSEVWDKLGSLPIAQVQPQEVRSEKVQPEAEAASTGATSGPLLAPSRRTLALSSLAFATFLYSFYWNFRDSPMAMPKVMQIPGRLLRLEQKWNMFSNPPRSVVWVTAEGYLEDGSRVMLRDPEGRPKRDPKTKKVTGATGIASSQFSSQRWRKYISNLANDKYRRHRRRYANYLCHEYALEHAGEPPLRKVAVYASSYELPPPGQERVSRAERVYKRKRWAKVRCPKPD